MDEKKKELNNNYMHLNIEKPTKANSLYDLKKANENDVLSKAKESILKFQNRIKSNTDINKNNSKYNKTEQNQKNKKIYFKDALYKGMKLEESEKILNSNNFKSSNSGKNIFQNNTNKYPYGNTTNNIKNNNFITNKNNNNNNYNNDIKNNNNNMVGISSPSSISSFSYNKMNNNKNKYNTENHHINKSIPDKFAIIEEEEENYSVKEDKEKEKTTDKDNIKIKDRDDMQNIINKTFIRNNNYFMDNNNNNNNLINNNIVNKNTENIDINKNKNDNIYDMKFENLKKEYEKIIEKKKYNNQKKDIIFSNIIEENEILKTEINKLIDENKNLKTELKNTKNEILNQPQRKRNNTPKNIKKINASNIGSASNMSDVGLDGSETSINALKTENALMSKKNDELSKQVKELKNRNKIQKKRIDDMEQMLKDKTDYISQMELKNKEINSNIDKNHLYKTKYNELLIRFDIINKELNQLKKSKNKNNELISEYDRLKENYNNLLKNQEIFDDNNNRKSKYDDNEYKKRIKKLIEDNKALNESIDKLKKEKILLKNAVNNNNNNKDNNNIIMEIQTENENLKKMNNDLNNTNNELKFENNSLKDICSEVQNKNKELKMKVDELQNVCENNKNQYIQNINKLQKDIIDFKQKELQEKNILENNVQKLLFENKNLKDINTKLMNEKQSLSQLKTDINNNIINSNNNNDINNINNINNEKIIELQKQINELIQYKNKCNYLDKNIFQLKTELKKIKQEKDLLTILVNNMKNKKDNNDDNINNNLDNKKDVKENKYTNIRICNNQSITYKIINNIDYDRGSNININKIQESDKEKEMLKTQNKDLEKNINMIQKKYDDLLKENNKLETKKNELIQQVNDLNDLIDLSNKDLVAKILDLKKVIEVLHKQIESEINKKNSLENKLLSLQQKINQMDDQNEKDEASKQNLCRESKDIIINNNNINLNESNADSINLDNYKNQIINLKNENTSLIKTINNLKNEIKSYKAKIRKPSSKKIDEKLLEKIKDINDEDLIKDMAEEMNKWKQEYYKLSKVNDLLKENIAKLEKNLGVGEEITYLKEALAKKDELLMNLTLQIKEYQSQSDDIIIGNTNKSKDKQIEILLKEVKGIRKRLLNMITLNDRITEFEDFMNNIKIIQELENKAKDKNVKKAFEQLNALIDVYKLNNDMAYNDFIVKLFMLE